MSVGTETGPTGKAKNCNQGVWADYEAPGSSATATLCNGGMYEGTHWWPCPSRYDCKSATQQAKEQETARSVYALPVVPGQAARAATMPVNQATALAPRVPTSNPASGFAGSLAGRGFQPPAPQQLVQPPPVPLHAAPMAPMPVVPPQAYPAAMQAPHVFHPQGQGMMGVTPTFLPIEGENVWGRLGKNIGQGMIGSFGYQIWSLASAVDFFGRR